MTVPELPPEEGGEEEERTMETAVAAAYRAIYTQLTSGTGLSGVSVYADIVPAGIDPPFVAFFWSGGGEVNRRRSQDAELVFTVKAVSYNQVDALDKAAAISSLLNDKGVQDTTEGEALEAEPLWEILVSSQEDAVHFVEVWAGAQPVYHAGARFRLVMEAKS